jgi:putative tricarboxylic transport membrane protein
MLKATWAETWEGVRMFLMTSLGDHLDGMIGPVHRSDPRAGASIASFVAYQQARMYSKHPELFGTGIPEGVLATGWSANNGVGPAA